MNLFARLEKSRDTWFLIATSVLFFILRLPSLFEPRWYGDEGIYQVIGLALDQGRLLYRDIWDNKPPLLYLTYALFHADQFWIRFASLMFGIAAVITFFFLAKKLFFQPRAVYASTLLFAFFFAIPLIEGNIANAENFMLFPILLAGYFVFTHRTTNTRILFFSGILLSLAFLYKVVAMFDAAAFGIFLVIQNYTTLRTFIFIEIKRLFPLIFGFAIPLIITVLFFVANHALSDFITAAFKQNVGYVGYGNTFIVAQGLLYLKLFLLAFVCGMLFFYRNRVSASTMFVVIWLAFSLFNAYFSGRPYTHYLLVLVPSFALFIGSIFNTASGRLLKAVIALILIVLIGKTFIFYTKSLAYYGNFLSFISGNKSVSAYRGFFDAHTPIDYDLAQYIKSHAQPQDRIFLWGNDAQVYALIGTLPPGRYTVAYHILWSQAAISETVRDLARVQPRFIILSPVQPFPFRLTGYTYRYTIADMNIYEQAH